MAAAKLLPPGAAQQSSTRMPGRSAAARTASRAAASCTRKCPSRKVSMAAMLPAPESSRQPSIHGWRLQTIPSSAQWARRACSVRRSVLTWTWVAGASLSLRSSGSSSASPTFSRSSATSGAGWE